MAREHSRRSCGAPTSACLLAFALVACGESGDSGSESSAVGSSGAVGSTGGASSGGQTTTGSPSAGETTGGQQSSTTVGMSNTTSSPSTTGGSVDAGVGGTAGASSGGATSSGGASAVGAGGVTSTGSAGSGGTTSSACTRELLDGSLDAYFSALAAGDPSTLPLAGTVKFTENAEQSEIGSAGLWLNAGDVVYSQRLLDTEECTAVTQAVVPEGGMDLPMALRIKVEAGEMTEIETIVIRPGDYSASFAVDSNPAAIIAMNDEVGWHDPVPQADRHTRAELVAWLNKYFRMFPSGICDLDTSCTRLENGGGNFSCSAGASCTAGEPGPNDDNLVPRLLFADVERGIAAGLTIFLEGHLDMHMIKMFGGKVYAVQAILGDTDGQSGWD